jgi:hypothetical protein
VDGVADKIERLLLDELVEAERLYRELQDAKSKASYMEAKGLRGFCHRR